MENLTNCLGSVLDVIAYIRHIGEHSLIITLWELLEVIVNKCNVVFSLKIDYLKLGFK